MIKCPLMNHGSITLNCFGSSQCLPIIILLQHNCYVQNVLRKIEQPQYLGVGASGKLVDFQSAITGKKRAQNPWMPPTHHNDMDFSDFLWESWFLT